MMKKWLLTGLLVVLLVGPASAFLYEVKQYTYEELKELSNEEIIEVYTESIIERTASESFHGKAGFTPREYKKFKELLNLIVKCRHEMLRRELDVPPINEWLR